MHVWQFGGAPFFVHLMGDSRGYDEWAQQMAGDWLGTGVFYHAPLYPYVIGTIHLRSSLFLRGSFVVVYAA
jgi:hypothetical protein